MPEHDDYLLPIASPMLFFELESLCGVVHLLLKGKSTILLGRFEFLKFFEVEVYLTVVRGAFITGSEKTRFLESI